VRAPTFSPTLAFIVQAGVLRPRQRLEVTNPEVAVGRALDCDLDEFPAASIPATLAPRSAAICAKRPAPARGQRIRSARPERSTSLV
jgi:hypothetical protein